jgi:hypothetical protein
MLADVSYELLSTQRTKREISSEISINIYQTAWCKNPENNNLQGAAVRAKSLV